MLALRTAWRGVCRYRTPALSCRSFSGPSQGQDAMGSPGTSIASGRSLSEHAVISTFDLFSIGGMESIHYCLHNDTLEYLLAIFS
jgi:hypothetical protein